MRSSRRKACPNLTGRYNRPREAATLHLPTRSARRHDVRSSRPPGATKSRPAPRWRVTADGPALRGIATACSWVRSDREPIVARRAEGPGPHWWRQSRRPPNSRQYFQAGLWVKPCRWSLLRYEGGGGVHGACDRERAHQRRPSTLTRTGAASEHRSQCGCLGSAIAFGYAVTVTSPGDRKLKSTTAAAVTKGLGGGGGT
jgi:hypothetical protein